MPAADPDRLPVFVYGTLRPGGRNHRAHLAGRTTAVRPGTLPGAALHDGPGYPYLVACPGRSVHGELVTLDPARYAEVLAALDHLEDCRPDGSGEYVRRRLEVTGAGGEPEPAWVYLAGAAVEAALRERPALIASGDWLRR
ncbi:gamma-glutamylcyclotransferase family protein [Kitasatospora camelliae]|uniref:Gamma-glutamylcyclotransferase family protein n=1 Tax=Kitasatospora camelliae TaxID=3156397 RepID=A0AAU8K2S9_9ACTN